MLVVYWNLFLQSGLNQLVSFAFQVRRIPISISWHPKSPSAMQRWVRRACVPAMGVAVVRWWTAPRRGDIWGSLPWTMSFPFLNFEHRNFRYQSWRLFLQPSQVETWSEVLSMRLPGMFQKWLNDWMARDWGGKLTAETHTDIRDEGLKTFLGGLKCPNWQFGTDLLLPATPQHLTSRILLFQLDVAKLLHLATSCKLARD